MSERKGSGFTLVELLIVTTLLGLVAVAIAAVFSIIVRTNPSTEARVDDARSLLGITTYLPGDTSSTPVDEPQATADIPNSDDPYDVSADGHWDRRQDVANAIAQLQPCFGYAETAGVNVLTLTWTQGITYRVHYRFASPDGAGWRLYRIYCAGSLPAQVIKLTTQLPEPVQAPGQWTLPVGIEWKFEDTDGAPPADLIVGAELTLHTVAGDLLRFDGSSNNPNVTLPPIPPSGGGGGSGSGTCTATITGMSPNPARNQSQPDPTPTQDQDPAHLKAKVVVTTTDNGSCPNLGIEYTVQSLTQWVVVDPSSGEVNIPAVATEVWADGMHTIMLKDGQASVTVLDTNTLEVR